MFVNIQLWPVNSLFALFGFGLALLPLLFFLRYYFLSGGPKSYWGWYQNLMFGAYTVMVTIDGILVLVFVIVGMRTAEAPRVRVESDSRFNGITSIMYVFNFYMSISYTLELWLIKFAFTSYFYTSRVAYKPWLQWYLLAVNGILAMTILGNIMGAFFYCRPIELNWSAPNRCLWLQSVVGITAQAFSNVFTDLCILVLAICCYHQLNSPTMLDNILIITMGILPPSMAINRYSVVYNLATDELASSPEMTRANASWGAMELYLCAIAFCLPVVKVTAKRMWIRYRESMREVDRPVKKWDIMDKDGLAGYFDLTPYDELTRKDRADIRKHKSERTRRSFVYGVRLRRREFHHDNCHKYCAKEECLKMCEPHTCYDLRLAQESGDAYNDWPAYDGDHEDCRKKFCEECTRKCHHLCHMYGGKNSFKIQRA